MPSDSEYEKQLLAHLFGERELSPNSWRRAAQELHEASRVLWAKWRDARERYSKRVKARTARTLSTNRLAVVSLMLAGMALENLLKSICIERKRGLEKHHELLKLAKSAGVQQLKLSECRLLAELSLYVIWIGRYPVPRTQGQMKDPTFGLNYWERFDGIYRKLGGWTYPRRTKP